MGGLLNSTPHLGGVRLQEDYSMSDARPPTPNFKMPPEIQMQQDLVDVLIATRVVSTEVLKTDLEPVEMLRLQFVVHHLLALALEITTSDEAGKNKYSPNLFFGDVPF